MRILVFALVVFAIGILVLAGVMYLLVLMVKALKKYIKSGEVR